MGELTAYHNETTRLLEHPLLRDRDLENIKNYIRKYIQAVVESDKEKRGK